MSGDRRHRSSEERPGDGPGAPLADLMKGFFGFSWALSLLGVQSFGRFLDALSPGGEPPASGDAPVPPGPAPVPADTEPAPIVPGPPGRLDLSRFVVLGEGWAAGMADFALRESWQRAAFPVLMAERMGAALPRASFAAPGLGDAPGFQRLPVRVPAPMGETVLDPPPSPRPLHHLALPGLTLADVLELRPAEPLVHRDDAKRTLLNFVVGMPSFLATTREASWPTPLEAALALEPTFVLVELGFAEVLEAAVAGDLAALPEVGAWAGRYERLVGELRAAGAEVLALTVPNPFDTAYFSGLADAGEVLRVAPSDLAEHWGLDPGCRLSLPGLEDVAFQIAAGRRAPPRAAGSGAAAVVAGETAARIGECVAELNAAVERVASPHGARVYDLHGLLRSIAASGIEVGGRRIGARPLEGFYSQDGYFPGSTGQGVVAQEILAFLNRAYGAGFPGVDLAALALSDPAAACRPARGPLLPRDRLPREPVPPPPSPPSSPAPRRATRRAASVPKELITPLERPPVPIELPPGGIQTLPLAPCASYFGDGIRPVNVRDARDLPYGSSAELLYGGLAMVDSNLSGHLTVRFDPPRSGVSRFVLDFEGGFAGDDTVLVAPQSFRMPFLRNRVDAVPGRVSSGEVVLATGEVRDLTVYAAYQSTALGALVSVNPTFPRTPLSFPGVYGSVSARFSPRPDGRLDFTFHGSTFVPLGPGIVWPLNYAGADGAPAVVPAAGTAMHPHLSLSTREPEVPEGAVPPELPENTVRELTLFTHDSCFGDAFDLATPDLGGPTVGRSHLLGRLEVQLGARTGDSMPVAFTSLSPGGVLGGVPASPLTQVFPGRLYDGPHGFNEFLHFPLRTYFLDDVYILDDPFDLSIGRIDLRSGATIGDVTHRGFIGQDLIFALLRVEPRTPKDSFHFRGPAVFERSPAGGTVLRFKGDVYVPYPEGFAFPQPNLTSSFVIGAGSRLDPYYWLHAVEDPGARPGKRGSARDVRASNGDVFSYRYSLPADPTLSPSSFEYVNQSQGGRFELRRLSWVDFADVLSGGQGADTVTFAGLGVWSRGGVESLQQVAVQISTAPGAPFVGIQVGRGAVSNVDTKPPDARSSEP